MAQASTAAAKQAQAEGSPLTTTVRTPTVWDGSTGSNRTTMSGLVGTGGAARGLPGWHPNACGVARASVSYTHESLAASSVSGRVPGRRGFRRVRPHLPQAPVFANSPAPRALRVAPAPHLRCPGVLLHVLLSSGTDL